MCSRTWTTKTKLVTGQLFSEVIVPGCNFHSCISWHVIGGVQKCIKYMYISTLAMGIYPPLIVIQSDIWFPLAQKANRGNQFQLYSNDWLPEEDAGSSVTWNLLPLGMEKSEHTWIVQVWKFSLNWTVKRFTFCLGKTLRGKGSWVGDREKEYAKLMQKVDRVENTWRDCAKQSREGERDKKWMH